MTSATMLPLELPRADRPAPRQSGVAPGAAREAGVVDVAALFAAHAPFLLRAVERLTGHGAHVEDIVQDVFVVAYRRRHELRAIESEGTALRGWLYGVARKRAAQHRRSYFRWARLRDAVDVEPRAPVGAPDDVVVRFEQALRVRRCVLALPFAQREVFVLHELEAMTAPQIAALLEVPEGTVWSRLAAARKQFRDLHVADEHAPVPARGGR